jgi:hypothetical protein
MGEFLANAAYYGNGDAVQAMLSFFVFFSFVEHGRDNSDILVKHISVE